MKRRFRSAATDVEHPRAVAEAATNAAPIVMAAVDLSEGMEPLAEALRKEAARVLHFVPGARLACINVQKLNRVGLNYSRDAEGRNIHVTRLVELKEWARPLALSTGEVTFHVLESPDPAAALIDFAKSNNVDQILICARASSNLRRYLGSVSSQVVAEAPCTVTVVRLPTGSAPLVEATDEPARETEPGLP
jgi:nucleotide-binding universal stress UspA family protein